MNSAKYLAAMRPSGASGIALVLFVASMTASCASQYVNQLSQVSATSSSYQLPTSLGIDACRDSLNARHTGGADELDATNIRLVNWNIHKTTNVRSKADLDSLADGKDLVLIQEASLREETINDIDATKHWSFAPGYRTADEITGVMTLSNIKPLTQCSFITMEPVLRTPKATSITQYALTSTEETLVVVNLHAVNFSLGVGAFQQQFDQVAEVLSQHRGPIILSGDFNTWRARRMQIVDALAERLELRSLAFAEDHRVRFFGQPLDHIYVRGLRAMNSDTRAVDTSDHNPMSATLSM